MYPSTLRNSWKMNLRIFDNIMRPVPVFPICDNNDRGSDRLNLNIVTILGRQPVSGISVP